MRHAQLRSVAHNLAASLASGIGLMIGVYETDVFGEAARSPGGTLTVDFLAGDVTQGRASAMLARAVRLYRDALPVLCAKHRVPAAAFAELTAQYQASPHSGIVVTVKDRSGKRTCTVYGGSDGQRLRTLDRDGRVRRMPVRRVS